MALPNLPGQKIQDTYQRLLQVSRNGEITDGTGSLFTPPTSSHSLTAITASHALYAVSASHEVTIEQLSSKANSIYSSNITDLGNDELIDTFIPVINTRHVDYQRIYVTSSLQYNAVTGELSTTINGGSF